MPEKLERTVARQKETVSRGLAVRSKRPDRAYGEVSGPGLRRADAGRRVESLTTASGGRWMGRNEVGKGIPCKFVQLGAWRQSWLEAGQGCREPANGRVRVWSRVGVRRGDGREAAPKDSRKGQ